MHSSYCACNREGKSDVDHIIFDNEKLLCGLLSDIKMYAHIKYFAIIFMSIIYN